MVMNYYKMPDKNCNVLVSYMIDSIQNTMLFLNWKKQIPIRCGAFNSNLDIFLLQCLQLAVL